MGSVPCEWGDGCIEDREVSRLTPAAVQAGAPAQPPAGTPDFEIEIVKRARARARVVRG